MLFNNRIYGLTKGQYSPTSEQGKITYSTPMGSLDYPFNPTKLALGARGAFVAKTIDRDLKHLQSMIKRARSIAELLLLKFIKIVTFLMMGFFRITDKETKSEEF